MLAWVQRNVFGHGQAIPGPFGPRRRRYFDYTATGLPFRVIEELLQSQVLPLLSNIHSSSSYACEVVSAHVQGAYDKVRRSVRATEDDVVLFTGTGTTGAVNRLIDGLGLRLPEPLAKRYGWEAQIPHEARPIVLLTRMEHHSNELPWRESIADVEYVGYDDCGRANWRDVDRLLSSPEYRDRPLKIGSFSAASNVTGILNDTKELAAAIHAHGGLACFDFAAAAPHVAVDLHPEDNPAYQKDAVFLSVHKLLGGPQSPGLLIANRKLFPAQTPVEPGGGTVLYTSPWEYRYLDDLEQRESGGTPAIVQIIRAGLAFDLKNAVGEERLRRFEDHCIFAAATAWRNHPKITILGPDPLTVPRLGVLSIIFDQGQLHHNLAVRLLNDLYGIQARGGCMCAGTYGHDLLQIGKAQSQAIRTTLDEGNIAAKPGWVRVSFGPAVTEDDLQVLLEAVPHVAERWRDYAPHYVQDPKTADWQHRDAVPYRSELCIRIPGG